MSKFTYQVKIVIGEVCVEGPKEDVALAYARATELKYNLVESYGIVEVAKKAEIHLESR